MGKVTMPTMLNWNEDRRFVVGETAFQSMPETTNPQYELGEGEFFVFKPRNLVEDYAELLETLRPKQILELGVFQGGSTMFLAELARPRKLVAIDLKELDETRDRLERQAAATGLAGAVRVFGEVDQADRDRMAEIVETEFENEGLDLVIDDCSHMYEPTRASFNELFPRLRPGGVYLIEDWRWAHTELGSEHPGGLYPGEVPLTRLLFEIVLAIPSVPGLVEDISIGLQTARITRGDAVVAPSTFDISACSNPPGRALLAPA